MNEEVSHHVRVVNAGGEQLSVLALVRVIFLMLIIILVIASLMATLLIILALLARSAKQQVPRGRVKRLHLVDAKIASLIEQPRRRLPSHFIDAGSPR